jgi:putative transposase
LIPKYRRKVITERVGTELGEAFAEVCERFETGRDHAHLLVTYPPKVALSKLVMSRKTISSMRDRSHSWPEVTRTLRGEHFWSPSNAVVSCGGAPLEVIRRYVEMQGRRSRPPGCPTRR